MKAIGKGSIASMLSVVLHFIRIILYIALAVLFVLCFILPVLPMILDWAMQFENVNIDVDDPLVGMDDIVEIISAFVSVGVVLYVVNRLLEILKTLRLETPFVKENAVRFRRVGFALIVGEASKIVLGILGAVVDADIDKGVEITNLIAIAAVFVLSEVFLEGARMKEEQELTV